MAALGKPDLNVEVVDIAHWQPIQRVAERFQQGRIFLAGDAAHTMPPKLGLGVNTAIQSVHNLAWKLAAVLKGQADPALLETYQGERQPVGLLAADQSFTGPAMALFEKEFYGEAQTHKAQLPMLQIIIGYRYHSQAVLTEGTAPFSGGIDLIDPMTELNGQPGTRVPHLWVEREGKRISTLDLFDSRFVLLTGSDGSAWRKVATEVAAKMGIALASYSIGETADLRDLEQGWQAKLGMSSTSALLLRPDGFVAWRATTLPTDPESQLEQVFAHILR